MTNGQTDRQTEWPLAIVRSSIVGRTLKRACTHIGVSKCRRPTDFVAHSEPSCANCEQK